jgi:hypothetical protein
VNQGRTLPLHRPLAVLAVGTGVLAVGLLPAMALDDRQLLGAQRQPDRTGRTGPGPDAHGVLTGRADTRRNRSGRLPVGSTPKAQQIGLFRVG